MDVQEDSVSTPSPAKLYSVIFLHLCANFNPFQNPLTVNECRFKTDFRYDLMALRNKTLRVTTMDAMPLSGYKQNPDGRLTGTGVAFHIFHEIQEKVGFNYEIILPDSNQIGSHDKGVIKLLYNNEVDMAVMFFPMLKEYRGWLTFSQSLGEFDWVLLMKRPLASATGSGILAPFEINVWIAILVSVLVVSPTIYFMVLLRIRICKNDEEVNRFYPLPSCFWFVYGALMKQGSVLSPLADSARILFATWWIFITILTSFYTANLTAFLTLSQFTLTVKTPEDIVKYNRFWMADWGGNTFEMINNAFELEILRMVLPKYGRFLRESDDKLDEVSKDKIFVGEKRETTLLMVHDYLNKTERNIPEVERCKYVLTQPFLSKPMAFAFTKEDSRNLAPLINPLLSSFVQGGIVEYLLNKPLPITTYCPLNLASSERKLRNSDLITTYYCVGFGFGLGLLFFIIECIFRKKKKQELSINSGDITGSSLVKRALFGPDKAKSTKEEDQFRMYYQEFYSNRTHNRDLFDPKHRSTFLFQYTH